MKLTRSLRKNSAIFIGILLLLTCITVVIHLIPTQEKNDVQEKIVASVKVAPASYKTIFKYLSSYGRVSFSPEQIERLTIQYEALVNQIYVIPGQRVNNKDRLVSLGTSISTTTNVKNAQLSVKFAQKEYERVKNLREQFLSTNADLQTAQQNLAKYKVSLLSLENQQKNGTILSSDFSGTIITVNTEAGQIVSPNTSLLTYSKGNDRQIRLGVEVEDINQLKQGQKVIIYNLQNSNIKKEGFIKDITGQVDPTTGLIDVVILLKNAPIFIPGSLVRGEIIIEENTNQLTVPRSAVLYMNNKPYVFVVKANKAEKRFIETGNISNSLIGIVKGVKPNEDIVTLGNYELQDGMSVMVTK